MEKQKQPSGQLYLTNFKPKLRKEPRERNTKNVLSAQMWQYAIASVCSCASKYLLCLF